MTPSRITLHVTRLLLLLALLTACEGGATPTVRPGPPPPPSAPTFAPATATALWAALATPDRATPPPPPPPPLGRVGWLYINEGALRFYDPATATVQPLAGFTAAITGTLAPSGAITAFTVAPSGRWVAYWQAGGSPPRADLWLLDLGGGAPRHIAGPVTCSNPQQARTLGQTLAFSPDGATLAYALPRADCTPFDLWLAATDGAGAPRRRVAPEAGLLLAPQWSPDGQQIAFLQAGDLGSGGVYDANITVVAATGALTPTLLVAGHALPAGRQALPPFDLTWLDARTLAFQSWNPTLGPDGTWAVDSAGAGAPPRLLTPAQVGLAAWSAAGAGPRRLAYRVAGLGLVVLGQGDAAGGAPLAPAPGVRGSGAIPPLWSPEGAAVAFTDGAGRLSLARRAAPGPPLVLPVADPLRAAWSPHGAPPLLAVVNAAGTTVALFDSAGTPIATLPLPRLSGSPAALVWLPSGPGPRRLALRVAGSPPAFLPLTAAPSALAAPPVPVLLAADSPLVGVAGVGR